MSGPPFFTTTYRYPETISKDLRNPTKGRCWHPGEVSWVDGNPNVIGVSVVGKTKRRNLSRYYLRNPQTNRLNRVPRRQFVAAVAEHGLEAS